MAMVIPAAVIVLLLLLPSLAVAVLQLCDADGGNYTANGTYHANLQLLSSTLPAIASSSPDLFAKAAAGDRPDRVFGLILCRGDVTVTTCLDCVATAFYNAQVMCPYARGAFILDDACLLRFSGHGDFLDSTANLDQIALVNDYNVSDPTFPRLVRATLTGTARWAAENNSTTKQRFATARVDVGGAVPRLYTLAQCTPDLSASECWRCLEDLITNKTTNGRVPAAAQGARIVGVRCGYRYEVYLFYAGEPLLAGSPAGPLLPTSSSSLQLPVPVEQHSGKRSKKWIIALALPLLSVSVGLIFCCWWKTRLRKRKVRLQKQNARNLIREDTLEHWGIKENNSEFSLFDLSQLSMATRNFADENLLGRGGFGTVYKGQLLNGLEIAVKRLDSHSGQGLPEFENEIQLIAKLQHINLVSILGCCVQGEENILVYEYMPNKSLDFFIFDKRRAELLTWKKRLHIIEGIAQGLLYLHRHSRLRIIHRDLKASNILLDKDMNPKISDFGLAKIFSSKDIQGRTNRVVGTYGYMSPEYASKGVFSVKSDVYGFGVLLLEVVCGKRNSGSDQYGDFFNLLCCAWQFWKDEKWFELVDPSLVNESRAMETKKCLKIGLLCVQENAADRPTMSDVVTMLSSENMTLPEPKQPAYFNLRTTDVQPSSSPSNPSTANEVTITVVEGR